MKRNTKVKVIDTEGLDNNTINLIETIMNFNTYYEDNDTVFVELQNSKGGTVRIFPERISLIKD